eukprot:3778763-Alexandrium_andersonii.AAC.1
MRSPCTYAACTHSCALAALIPPPSVVLPCPCASGRPPVHPPTPPFLQPTQESASADDTGGADRGTTAPMSEKPRFTRAAAAGAPSSGSSGAGEL